MKTNEKREKGKNSNCGIMTDTRLERKSERKSEREREEERVIE
jgi:hypothetical protein